MHGPVHVGSLHSTPMQQHRQVKQQTLSEAATQLFASSPCQESGKIATGPCATARGYRSPQLQQLQQRAWATSTGALTPNVGGFRTPCSMALPIRPSSGLHTAQTARGRSHEPQARFPMMPIYAHPSTLRSRSGTPTPRKDYPPYIVHKHAAMTHSHLPNLPTPARMRTGVVPIAPAVPASSTSQTTMQTTSAVPVSTKDQGRATDSLSNTMNRVPQASTQATGPSAQSSGVVGTEQFQQVAAKLQAHQLAQSQSTAEPLSNNSMMTQTHAQDLVATIQLPAEALQERAYPRPSLEDQDAERLLLQRQGYEDAIEDLKRSRREEQELQAQLQQVQADITSEEHNRARAEQDSTAKALEYEKRADAGRKLENERSELESRMSNIRVEAKAKDEELQSLHEQMQSVHEEMNGYNELAECLSHQIKELRQELARIESKNSAERQQQRIQEESEAQRRQIEELRRYIAEFERHLSTPQPLSLQENERLKRRISETHVELDSALQQLKLQQ